MADPVYPFADEPAAGDGLSVEIAPDVHWIRMPLSAPLRWINVWALFEPDGATVVDTGILSPDSIAAWERVLAGLLNGRQVRRVISTHMHPDHCGLAGWFVEHQHAELWMSRLEYLTCRVLSADTGRAAPAAALGFYRAAGWSDEALERYRARFGFFGEMIYPFPASYTRLSDGDELTMAGHTWRVITGNGHSPEHACLYCPAMKLLISGDQVLPRISSNVSVFPTEPEADPLADWITSLQKLGRLIPDEVLVLPAHNSPFQGLHARLQALQAHHEGALQRLQQHLCVPKRTVEVFGTLFARPIAPDSLMMATGEALAHLNYLRARGLARRELDASGVWHWSAAAAMDALL